MLKEFLLLSAAAASLLLSGCGGAVNYDESDKHLKEIEGVRKGCFAQADTTEEGQYDLWVFEFDGEMMNVSKTLCEDENCSSAVEGSQIKEVFTVKIGQQTSDYTVQNEETGDDENASQKYQDFLDAPAREFDIFYNASFTKHAILKQANGMIYLSLNEFSGEAAADDANTTFEPLGGFVLQDGSGDVTVERETVFNYKCGMEKE